MWGQGGFEVYSCKGKWARGLGVVQVYSSTAILLQQSAQVEYLILLSSKEVYLHLLREIVFLTSSLHKFCI